MVQYVDEAFPEGRALFPKDPLGKAKARIWGDFVQKHINTNFFRVLMKETTEEREQSKKDLLAAYLKITKAMDPEGPYFLGKDFGYVDIMLYPEAQR